MIIKLAWRSLIRSWRYQTTMQLATLGVLVGSFVTLSLAVLFQQNLKQYLFSWGSDIKVSVYLTDEISETDKNDLATQLNEIPFFKSFHYLSKQEAYQKFKSRVSAYAPTLVAQLENNNPLPASFEVVANANRQLQFETLLQFLEEVKKRPGVEDVSYGLGWIKNYASVIKVFSIMSVLVLLVLLSGMLFVVGNSIRSSIEQRRDEIEILELFGATRNSIVWPYVIEGALLGLLSAILAVVFVYIFYVWQLQYIINELGFLNLKNRVDFLTSKSLVLIIISGALLGGLGSYLWARKISTGWAAASGGVQ